MIQEDLNVLRRLSKKFIKTDSRCGILDFSESFDKILHDRPIQTIRAHGIYGVLEN